MIADGIGQAADPEILHGALCLGAPKRRSGYADFAEAVLFDAVVVAHG